MHPLVQDSEEHHVPASGESDTTPDTLELNRTESRNFVVFMIYQVVMRAGWIFKTESIIMPAVLDSLGGSAWLRGCLPLLNRFGQSVPPLLLSRRVKITPLKKYALATCSFIMALCFLCLSGIWFSASAAMRPWLPWVFLVFYGIFFAATGVNQMTFGTLQGKLIPATRRGRLLWTTNVFAVIAAISCAWFLLPLWLREDRTQFAMLFGFSGLCFALSAASTLLLVEHKDWFTQAVATPIELFRAAGSMLRRDARFQRLAIVATLFGTTFTLFPHYQALGRRELTSTDLRILIAWVILQNLGTGLFSFFAGPLADRRGNRLVLRILLLAVCIAPTLSLGLARLPGMHYLFSIVFVLVGMTPVVIRMLQNYTLEISKPSDHPKYLSTLSICMAAPAMLSPLVGWLIQIHGYGAVFVGLTGILFVAWLLTFTLAEPRHRIDAVDG